MNIHRLSNGHHINLDAVASVGPITSIHSYGDIGEDCSSPGFYIYFQLMEKPLKYFFADNSEATDAHELLLEQLRKLRS